MPKDSIHFIEEDIKSQLKEKTKLKKYLIEQTHKILIIDSCQLNYIFCSDEALLQRNIQFLNHDTYTDIITFDLSDDDDNLIGEIYISVDRVKENAEKFNVTYASELHRVIFHGWLHLLGFNDKTPEQEIEMRTQEDLHLKQYFNQIEVK